MSYHARPLPAPGRRPAVATTGPATPSASEAPPGPDPASVAPPARPIEPAPRSPEAAAATDEPTNAGPWYRTESWLVVSLLGFLPLLLALAAPQNLRVPLVSVAGLLIACGLVMLVRRGTR